MLGTSLLIRQPTRLTRWRRADRYFSVTDIAVPPSHRGSFASVPSAPTERDHSTGSARRSPRGSHHSLRLLVPVSRGGKGAPPDMWPVARPGRPLEEAAASHGVLDLGSMQADILQGPIIERGEVGHGAADL